MIVIIIDENDDDSGQPLNSTPNSVDLQYMCHTRVQGFPFHEYGINSFFLILGLRRESTISAIPQFTWK